ncbi:hypothetical protein ACRQ5B_09010 [Pseudarthrobacter sp. L19]|uniref:hypothetical protein n=1 Tax=Pseudarthrobacter sp. L19 TaxID=3423951 RepID=UPI003D79F71D
MAIVLAAVSVAGVRRQDVAVIGKLAIVVAGATVIFAIANPERALIPCRPDKCSPLNSLLTSFFPQENVLAIFMILSIIPVLFGLSGPLRIFGTLLLVSLVTLSGSRTSIAAALGIVALSLLLTKLRKSSLDAKFRKVSAISVLVLFSTSALLFFLPLDPLAFTGRGFIYGLLRAFWLEQPIIGPGRDVLNYAYSIRISANYAISHEHGGMPYMLVNGGILGVAFFTAWLTRVVYNNSKKTSTWISGLALAFSVAVAIVSLTEPVWTYDLKSPALWSLALVSSSLCRPEEKNFFDEDSNITEKHAS